MESGYQTSKLERLLHRTTAGFFALSAVCFMIYTTELNYAHADEEDLGSASSSLGASVTVGTACNFSGNVDIPHTSTVMNGVNSTDTGKTTLNVTCNDQGGYAVYAIGYTNDEYGNTALQSSISDDYNISTGTSTSGSTSNWSMKLSTVPGTTTATIENGYSNYSTVPDDFTKVASLNTITDPSTPNTGSSISTTYQAYISPTQPAGTYSGKVKYTLVHPSTAPAPEKPVFMQDTAKIKSKLTNTGDTMQAIDSRDGKSYWVTKLADGNIWMTQNLDLDIEAGRTYTSADTDLANSTISTTWTPTVSTSTTSSWTSSYTAPESYDPGNLYWNGALIYDQATCEKYGGRWTSYAGCFDATEVLLATGNTHYNIGNYYNWTAAVAMNDSSYYTSQQDVNQSICPAGWRLPTHSGDKSYQNLISAQGLTAGTSGNIQNSPVYFIYSGAWYGEFTGLSQNGGYVSSVVKSGSWAYWLSFGTSGNLQFEGTRYHGISLRCVAR